MPLTARDAAGELLHRIPQGWKDLIPVDLRYRLRRQLGRSPSELARRPPPPPAPGEDLGAPDFIGIGVQKAGTTRWHRLIAAHPGVASTTADRKELHYFSRFGTAPFSDEDVRAYERWFPRKSPEIAGEWTPDYFYLPWVPYLVSLAAPNARLLVCLRDPVERFRSGLALNSMILKGHSNAVVGDALQQGLYLQSLTQWLQYFDRGQLLLLQHEQNVADPVSQLATTYEFLHLDPSFVPPEVSAVFGGTQTKSAMDDSTRDRLIDIYLPDVRALQAHVPDFDFSLWPNFADRV